MSKVSVTFLDELNLDNQSLVGFGPMSLNSIEALKQSALNSKFPITVIASRNQIESDRFGGGYVNNWSTQSFMRDLSGSENLIFGRDHGGPYQSGRSKDFATDEEAMSDAIQSFKDDIDSGFTFLHLDPCKYTKGDITIEGMADALCEMLGQVQEYAGSKGVDVRYEVGEEGHSKTSGDPEELDLFLSRVFNFIEKKGLQRPSYCVAKLGSFVREDQNVGNFIDKVRQNEVQGIRDILKIIRKYGMMAKQHNADYLPTDVLKEIPQIGIGAINIAPELGVIESKLLINAFKKHDLSNELEQFFQLVDVSGTWRKWTDSSNTNLEHKTAIAGHYVYALQEFKGIKEYLLSREPNLDSHIQAELVKYINSVLGALNIRK